jgi:hypothetical protein
VPFSETLRILLNVKYLLEVGTYDEAFIRLSFSTRRAKSRHIVDIVGDDVVQPPFDWPAKTLCLGLI